MGIPEARHNLVAVGGGLFRLPKRMPYHLVMELALTADMWPAEKLHQYGVINRLTEPGKALEVAIELAERLLENGPTALIASKEIIRRSYEWTEEEAWIKQKPIAKVAMESKDRDEGLRAFAEKRKPIWVGRIICYIQTLSAIVLKIMFCQKYNWGNSHDKHNSSRKEYKPFLFYRPAYYVSGLAPQVS